MMEPSFWGKSETDGATLHPKGDGVVRRRRHQTNTIALSAGVPKRKLAFAYDGQSRRIAKKVFDWNAANNDWSLTLERRFVYDGWNLVAEVDGSGNLVKSHTWGLDLSQSQQGAGGVGGLLWTHDAASSQTHFMAYDGNGNVTALVKADSSNTVSARYDYNAFGETVLQEGDGTLVSNSYRFSTKYQDEETGLYYYGYRYYSPELGRWLNRDFIEEAGGVNLYAMVGNDTVNKWDYLGLTDVTLSHQRISRDYFGTYGKLTMIVNNDKLKGGCCEIPSSVSFLTIELPPKAKVPAITSNDGSVSRFYTGLVNSASGKAYLKNPSLTSILNKVPNADSYRPEGLGDEEWLDLKEYAISTGIDAINIHLGEDSLWSGGCILIGTSYVPIGFKLPRGAIFEGLQEDIGYPHVTGFAIADSAKAQVDLTYYLWCLQKTKGSKLNMLYTRTGTDTPPMATNPYNGNNLSAPSYIPSPESSSAIPNQRKRFWPF